MDVFLSSRNGQQLSTIEALTPEICLHRLLISPISLSSDLRDSRSSFFTAFHCCPQGDSICPHSLHLRSKGRLTVVSTRWLLTMAFNGRVCHQKHTILQLYRSAVPRIHIRTFAHHKPSTAAAPQKLKAQQPAYKSCRSFSKRAAFRVQSQEAPNAQAYLNSGAIAGARNLVDVKKVLVIGSGGLSIGQAGEFDYSGIITMSHTYNRQLPLAIASFFL